MALGAYVLSCSSREAHRVLSPQRQTARLASVPHYLSFVPPIHILFAAIVESQIFILEAEDEAAEQDDYGYVNDASQDVHGLPEWLLLLRSKAAPVPSFVWNVKMSWGTNGVKSAFDPC